MSASDTVRSVIAKFPDELSAAEIEAIRWRADSSIIPYVVWIRMTADEKSRVGRLRQEDAKQLLRERTI